MNDKTIDMKPETRERLVKTLREMAAECLDLSDAIEQDHFAQATIYATIFSLRGPNTMREIIEHLSGQLRE
jgi:predicted translin family RNA/ssDNA-binding protein